MDVRVGYLPDPYKLDVAYCGGQPVGTVERFVMDAPDPDRLGPYIRKALQESFEVDAREEDIEGSGVTGC